MDMMTYEQFERMKEAVDKAEKDDTPYIGTVDNEMHVIGNVNNTEVKPATYTVQFAFPDTKEWRSRVALNNDKIVRELDRYIVVERVYKNVYITPRNIGKAVMAFSLVEQFYRKITEDGQVKNVSEEEAKILFNFMNSEIGDATYEVCQAVLRIPYDEVEWILPLSAIENAIMIVTNNPSVMNEADLFFGSPLAKA